MSSIQQTKRYDTVVSAFNDSTHYRSVFHGHTPSFASLAAKYPGFKELFPISSLSVLSATSHASSVPCSFTLDWTNPTHVLLYTKILLQEYLGLTDWTCPSNRLCPTVTSRLNYILWVEDLCISYHTSVSWMNQILNLPDIYRPTDTVSSDPTTNTSSTLPRLPTTYGNHDSLLLCNNVYGIDIGTGASCIYPLIGFQQCRFNMLGTDIDPLNITNALENIRNNHLDSCLSVLLTNYREEEEETRKLSSSIVTETNNGTSNTTITSSSTSSPTLPNVPYTNDPSLLTYPISYYQTLIQSTTNYQSIQSHPSSKVTNESPYRYSSLVSNTAIDPSLYQQAYRSLQTLTETLRNITQRIPIIDFTMCNPPFYSSWQEAQDSMNNAVHRTACTGTEIEMSYPGGEVAFIQRMIKEIYDETTDLSRCTYNHQSVNLNSTILSQKYAVRWYTSMVGKYSSLEPLLQLLRNYRVPTIRITELYQGKTARWCLAWSWYPSSIFLCTGWRYVPFSETMHTSIKDTKGNGKDNNNINTSSLLINRDIADEEQQRIEHTLHDEKRVTSIATTSTTDNNSDHPQTKRQRIDSYEFLTSNKKDVPKPSSFFHKADSKHLLRIFHIGIVFQPSDKSEFLQFIPKEYQSRSSTMSTFTFHLSPNQCSYHIIPSLKDQQYIRETIPYKEPEYRNASSFSTSTTTDCTSSIVPPPITSSGNVSSSDAIPASLVIVPDLAELYVRIEEALPIGEVLHNENMHMVMIPIKQSVPLITLAPFKPLTRQADNDGNNSMIMNETNLARDETYRTLQSWIVYCIRVPKDYSAGTAATTTNTIATATSRDDNNVPPVKIIFPESCVNFSAEIQLLVLSSSVPKTNTPKSNYIPLTIVTSLLTVDDQYHGTEAYERYVNRLQRDILRTGRKWRRRINRENDK